MLSEPRIQRYARQILLRDVGGVGQEALGAQGVRLSGQGPLLEAARTYLQAGGTSVEPRAGEGAWAPGAPVLEEPPRTWLAVGSPPVPLDPPCVGVAVRGAAIELWSAGAGACLDCMGERLFPPAAPALAGPRAVVAGAALALLVQRRLLGLGAPLEGVAVTEAGVLQRLEPPRCPHRAPVLAPSVLAAVLAHLCSAWPEEGCGVLLEGESGMRFLPLANAQAAHHARDPEAFPRDAHRAFTVEPATWLRLLREAEARGEQVAALVHSHPEGPAHFSDEDRRQAAPDGSPLHPRMAHLVVALHHRTPVKAVWALWRNGGFTEFVHPLPGENPK
jgi:proteasome lid subunit RPN8/RPN11